MKGLGEGCDYPLATSHLTWISEDIILFTTVSSSGSPHSILHRAQIDNDKISVL